jgi:hypothetical protein
MKLFSPINTNGDSLGDKDVGGQYEQLDVSTAKEDIAFKLINTVETSG